MRPSSRHADVVIIGGGVIGASIAFHLAQADIRNVVLLESHQVASGSSGKPIAGVRAQFSDPLNIALGQRSLEAYGRFPEQIGCDIGLERVGYLFLLREQEDVVGFETSVALQNSMGVPSRMLSASEAYKLNPYIDPSLLVAAAFSAEDGYARPRAVAQGYVNAARQYGAEVFEGCEVVDIVSEVAGIAKVHTLAGTISTPTVICAAGAWSKSIGAMVGVELPIEPLRRQIAFTSALEPIPPRIPFTIDFGSTGYFHNCDSGLLLGVASENEKPGFVVDYTQDWLPELRAATARYAPMLADVAITSGWAGLYEMTPDRNALIGEESDSFRFLYAAGFSGHGFLQAPAVGEILRDLYLGDQPFVDSSPFGARRFQENRTRVEMNVI